MWQRIAAGALVMTGAVGFGTALCGEISGELAQMKKIRELLIYITGEIEYLKRPMSEILKLAAERIGAPYDEFLDAVCAGLDERSGKPLGELWQDGLVRLRESLPREALSYMEKMGHCFGLEGDKMQIESFKLFGRELDDKITLLSEKKSENCRLIRALSALAGILCIVLFL